jgi:Asp-tRNA(Asn)/Glu-tRNA(Gln) amidotransferase A subunit family amidase
MMLAQPVSLLALIRAVDAGETTASRELAAFAARAAEIEPALGAFAAADWPRAIGLAAPMAGLPLKGLPVGMKDIFDTSFLPTSYGSPIYADHRPDTDAAIVSLFAGVGATIPVKTVTTEFAFFEPARTGNPWRLERSPGGSSSGSAAAVAAGLLPAATGTQTVGSTVRPASFCGIVGFKPTFGLLPTQGMKVSSESLDTVGLFTAGVDDMRWLFAALRGQDPRLQRPEAAALRIGVLRTPWDGEAQPAARTALETAISRLDQAGVRIADVALPDALAAADAIQPDILGFEAARALAQEHRLHRSGLSQRLAGFLDEAVEITPQTDRDARAVRARAGEALPALFADFDALLTFASADVAPPDRSFTGSPVFNRLWTLLGVPCMSVPGLMANDLPIGIQLVGALNRDEHLLATAAVVASLLAPN